MKNKFRSLIMKYNMERGVFRFKQFSCQHFGSSMRIGVDAVLLGAWASVDGARILDVGTGCGVIALMCAQRNVTAIVDAVETDAPSVEEAGINFNSSPWGHRLNVFHDNYLNFNPAYKYDRIVSNPPYFDSGVDSEASVRMHARHEGDLSPISLLRHGLDLLAPGGSVSMVVPYLRAETIIGQARDMGFYPVRLLDVSGHAEADVKRCLLEFNQDSRSVCKTGRMALEIAPTVPTPEYRELCKDFYLYF